MYTGAGRWPLLCSARRLTVHNVVLIGIPTDESNLVMRALQLFADKTGQTQRIHCRLHKAAPAQAGLGAGSSDAATAMHAANRLTGFPATQDQVRFDAAKTARLAL